MDTIYSCIKASHRKNLSIGLVSELQSTLGDHLSELGHSLTIFPSFELTTQERARDIKHINNDIKLDVLIVSTSLFFIDALGDLLRLLSQTKKNSLLFVCDTALASPVERQVQRHEKQRPIALNYFFLLLQRLGFHPYLPQGLNDEPIVQPSSMMLIFKRSYLPAWQIQSDFIAFNAFKALFYNCFGTEISLSEWQWKLGSQKGKPIVALKDGQVIAYYGGIKRDISLFGENNTALQICDVMVDKQYQGVLSKKGIFQQLAATFLENNIGYNAEHILGYGFPTHRAMKLAKRINLYDAVDSLVELQWPVNNSKPLWSTQVRIIESPSAEIVRKVDRLWQKMTLDYQKSIIGVRNWAYLEHRYLNCPVKEYQLFSVQSRFSSEIKGLFVLRYIQAQNHWMLVDIIAARDNFPVIIEQALRVVKRSGGEKMVFWITQSHHQYLPQNWVDKKELHIDIPCNIWSAGPSIEQIKNAWWLTAGDADFM